MMSYICMCIFLAFSVSTLVVEAMIDYWAQNSYGCGDIKQKMAANHVVNNKSQVVNCIFNCYYETSELSHDITPDQCFRHLLLPYITKILKKKIPSDDETKACIRAKDRSKCKDTLLYYFAKWYKEKFNTDHQKKIAVLLYSSWANIPDIRRGTAFGNWELSIANVLQHLRHNDDRDRKATIEITSLSDPLQYPDIHRELKRYCYRPIKEDDKGTIEFCRLRMLINIAKKINAIAKGKEQYKDKFEKYVGAIESNFIAFSVIYYKFYVNDDQPNTLALDQRLDELADLTRDRDTGSLRTFLQFMPEPYLLEKACKANSPLYPVAGRRCCILQMVVEQLLIYSSMAEKRKEGTNTKAVTINYSLNLRSVITELRGEEIFKMMVDSRYQDVSNEEAISNLIEGKFGQLKGYFAKLQSFNMQKASADVGYVKGRIEYYGGRVKKAIDDVSEKVGGVLKAALITQGLEVAEKIVKLTLAIAEACNPFKAVFNGGTATDIMDATAELMKAISGLVEATALKKAWKAVIETVQTISGGFQKNSEFLSAVGRIVAKVKINDFPDDDEFEQCKSTFLRLYNDYSPKVDKEMLAVLATKFDTSVTSGCDLINAATGSAANGYVAYVKKNLFCQKAEASTSSLKTIFEEIYDFQFEFIENMASYLRSATGYQASQEMITFSSMAPIKTGEANKRRSELRANIIMAHVTYEMQKQGVVESLCDFLEYEEGGITPAVCKASTIDVPTLLSYIPTRCKSVRTYVSIPITTSSSVKPGYIDIRKVYSGEEVSFDIPDYDWMKKHKWIDPDIRYQAIYIRNFEIILPTFTQGEKRVEVTVRSMGGNKFRNGGTKYTLIPSESFSIVYTGGNRYYPCSGDKKENPYNICEDRKLPNLCVMSDDPVPDDARILYPTTFARFKVKAYGTTPSQTPDPETPLDIKAKINMCIFKNEPTRKKRSVVQRKAGCCEGNSYWNETRSSCLNCEGQSWSNLNGYYCEKNQHALLQRERKKHS